jgi:ankyrin repeat protein
LTVDKALCFTRQGPAMPSRDSGGAGATPLHLSAIHGHLEICRLLLQCNADPQAKCRISESQNSVAPLQGAVENGHIEICRLLLQCNADPNQMNSK